jgi:hypothetical protein
VNDEKVEQTFDNVENETSNTDYLWNSKTNQWTGKSKFEYSYDANRNQILSINNNWDSINNKWTFYLKTFMYYSLFDGSNGITITKSPVTFSLYPNPAKDQLYIDFGFNQQAEISIFNNKGQLVGSFLISGKLTVIPVNNLQKGIYIIQIKKQNDVNTQKFIKQ